MSYTIKTFAQLTTEELYEMLQVRTNVFVVEQNCPYPEIDGKDKESYHLFKQIEGEMAAYLRILPPGVSYEQLSIGRVLVQKNYRGQQLGRELMNEALSFIKQQYGEQTIKIQAQDYLRSFYESFGFEAISDVYLEDNIPHIDMLLKKV